MSEDRGWQRGSGERPGPPGGPFGPAIAGRDEYGGQGWVLLPQAVEVAARAGNVGQLFGSLLCGQLFDRQLDVRHANPASFGTRYTT